MFMFVTDVLVKCDHAEIVLGGLSVDLTWFHSSSVNRKDSPNTLYTLPIRSKSV